MAEDPKENINLKSLLETYSIQDISDLFTKIDEKIVSLHEVSSQDFQRMQKDFRNFHQMANQISENASYLFEFITSNNSNELMIEDIDQVYNDLKSKSELVRYHVELVKDLINHLLSRLRQSFFPIKNFKQNLTSLKFLESNLELNASFSNDSDISPLQELCDNLKGEVVQVEKLFARLKQLLKDKFLLREQFNAEDIDINKVLDVLREEIEVYSRHFSSAKEIVPEIKAKTDLTSDSINKIITNLQYQDIIKQRMEHIQKIHKELLDELKNFEGENHTYLNEKAKYFLRLRDIAGLQAAQLMHTNKEYQSAIQRISDRFLEIGENMTLVSKECAEYTSFDSEKQKIFFNSLKNNLSQARDQIRLFCEFNANFRRNVDEIIGLIDQINERYSNIKPLIDELEDRLKKRAEEENSRQTGGNMVAQMVQVGEDLKGNTEIIQDIFKDFEKHRNDLNKNVIKKISREEENRCNELPYKIDNYLNRLNEMEEELVGKLKKNNELSDKIFREIQNSVNGIQYYEYFEQVIGEIIEELNTLNFNLKVNSEDEIDDKSENLKRLKEYYTMNTEFVIHDQITSGEEQQEEDLEVGEEEEGGDLELF